MQTIDVLGVSRKKFFIIGTNKLIGLFMLFGFENTLNIGFLKKKNPEWNMDDIIKSSCLYCSG